MKPIIILNGPPGSGKDTIATRLSLHQYSILSFKEPLFRIANDMLGDEQYKEFLYRYNKRFLKEKRWDYIGMSPRELMIQISESFVKPIIGQEAFGYLAADRVRTVLSGHPYLKGIVFPDGGFPSELKHLSNISGAFPFVVRLYREGFTFEGDSRDYLEVSDLDIALVDGKPELAVLSILEAVHERL